MKLDKRLFQLLPQCRRWIALNVALQWLGLLASVVAALALGIVFQALLASQRQEAAVWTCLWIMAGAVLLRAVFGKAAVYAAYRACVAVKQQVRLRLYRQMLQLYQASSPSADGTAATIQAASAGIEQLETYFGRYVPQLFYSLLAPLTLFAILAWLNWLTALVLLVMVPLIPLSIAVVNTSAKKLFQRHWQSFVNLSGRFLDNLQGLVTLKLYQDDGHQADLMQQDAQHFRQSTMRVLVMQLNSVSLMDLLAYGGAALGIGVGLWQFHTGHMALFAMVAFVVLAVEFFLPLRLLGSYFHVAMNGMTAANRVFEVLDTPIPAPAQPVALPHAPLTIALQDVGFAYQADAPVLQQVNGEMAFGQFVAIVGPSGGGKSTLASLLVGLNRPTAGLLTLNDVPLADIAPAERYQLVTLVSHHNHVFQGSLKDNLLLARADASDDDLYRVLAAVNLADFVRQHGGLDLALTAGGDNLSGGQLQRLALARALLHDAPVLVLDEAMSNVDLDNETDILQVLGCLKTRKTVVMITHRLAAAQLADQIWVMDKGQVVAQGNHEELMRNNDLYAQLYQQQAALTAIFHTAGGDDDQAK